MCSARLATASAASFTASGSVGCACTVRPTSSALAPIRVDVRENADSYTVFAELPGSSKDEIKVEIEGDEVVVSAERKRAAP